MPFGIAQNKHKNKRTLTYTSTQTNESDRIKMRGIDSLNGGKWLKKYNEE